MDSDLLLKYLRSTATDTLIVTFYDSNVAIYFNDPKDPNLLHVMMGVRL